jgi:protein-S-isoprenylcysteine O-methyltransferase Ste14
MGRSFRVGIDDRPTALVTTGVFRYVRNPIFSGLVISLSGFVLLTPSPWSLIVLLWIAGLISVQVRFEEAHLLSMHGEPYALYAGRVGRFVPGIGRWYGTRRMEPEGEACG